MQTEKITGEEPKEEEEEAPKKDVAKEGPQEEEISKEEKKASDKPKKAKDGPVKEEVAKESGQTDPASKEAPPAKEAAAAKEEAPAKEAAAAKEEAPAKEAAPAEGAAKESLIELNEEGPAPVTVKEKSGITTVYDLKHDMTANGALNKDLDGPSDNDARIIASAKASAE